MYVPLAVDFRLPCLSDQGRHSLEERLLKVEEPCLLDWYLLCPHPLLVPSQVSRGSAVTPEKVMGSAAAH